MALDVIGESLGKARHVQHAPGLALALATLATLAAAALTRRTVSQP